MFHLKGFFLDFFEFFISAEALQFSSRSKNKVDLIRTHWPL
jgi:hypothetical protein